MNLWLQMVLSLMLAIFLSGCSDSNGGSDSSSSSSSSSTSSSSSSGSSTSSSSSSGAAAQTPSSISLSFLGRYASGIFAQAAAEITAFDAVTQRAFVVNAEQGVLDVLDMSDPADPVWVAAIDANEIAAGAQVNSVAFHGRIIALAIEAGVKTDPGFVGFYDADTLEEIDHVQVGALPDMLIFTPDGQYVLVANEGEPNDDYSIDPEGSVSVINVSDLDNIVVNTVDFQAFNGQEAALRAQGVRIFGPGASAAQDFEPEYIAVSADSTTAWAALQENNALAKIDIATATVTDIFPLGFKDHGLSDNGFGSGNALDVSDLDGGINIDNWPGLRGLYMPDAIAAYSADGSTYLVTANEGDARAWGEEDDDYWDGDASKGFVEEFRVKHLVHADGFDRRAGDDLPPQLRELAAGALLNPDVFGYCGALAGNNPGDCRLDPQLGRLVVTWTLGYRTDGNGDPVMFDEDGNEDPTGDWLMYDALYAFGSRSFSIWDEAGQLVWDSGDRFEQFLAGDDCMAGAARNIPCKNFFNSNHEEGNALDNRSDNKGPEPEGLALGQLGDKTFAFIGLERMGGVMVYDITDPQAPVFVDYFNTRENWDTANVGAVLATAGDLGPEGLVFVSAEQSPNGEPLLIVGNEVSGTTAVFQINQQFAE